MSNSRYTRDEIIVQGLELADCGTLNQHDMPGGLVSPTAHSVKWLQNAMDMFHRKYPFATDIQDISITIPVGNLNSYLTSTPSLYLPSDFIIDVRDGIDIVTNNSTYSLKRLSYQYWRKFQVQSQISNSPRYYSIVSGKIKVLPLLSVSTPATLHYYALAPAFKAEDKINFPDEWSLIEFIKLKALEHVRFID